MTLVCMAALLDFDGEAALLHQEQEVSDLVLINQNSTLFRVLKLGVQQLLMGLEQIPQPAVPWCRYVCCGIHSGPGNNIHPERHGPGSIGSRNLLHITRAWPTQQPNRPGRP